jgi:hypothetical protein
MDHDELLCIIEQAAKDRKKLLALLQILTNTGFLRRCQQLAIIDKVRQEIYEEKC